MKVCSVCQRCYADSVLSCSELNHAPLTETRSGHREMIANYRLEFLLESSASGETFRASNTILGKPYLIKIIAPELFDEAQSRQFLRETQAISAIIHPNVVRVFESGTLADGSLYVVTEFLTAQTLRDCLENVGKPSEVTSLTITRQAAEALEAIHAVEVLHRSVSPENLILTSDAENHFLVKLQNIDFGGISQKIVTANGDLNLTALRYFSPEQCAAKDADAQTDVYGLGIILFESIAGKPPFDAPYADALISKHLNENPPPVAIHNFDIRMLLAHTLTDALQKTSRLRLKTANAMARRIRHIEQLATHSPTPPPAIAYPATMDKAAIVFSPVPKNENQTIIDEIAQTPLAVETPTIVEHVVETPVTVEARTVVDDVIETQTTVEDFVLTKNAPVVENLVSAENAPTVEDLVLTKNETVFKPVAAIETQPLDGKLEEIENIESPEIVYIDLTTTKLPPIESIIEPAPKMFVATENADIHKTNDAILVDWQQPDDIPEAPKTLKTAKKETAAEETLFVDNGDSIIDIGEADAPPEYLSDDDNTRPNYAAQRAVFSYDDSRTSWNLPDKRKLLMGAAIVALLVLTIGGTWLSRQFQLERDAERTTVQSAPNDKSQPKSAEPAKVSEPAKTADVKVNNTVAETNNSDVPELPDFQPREVTEKTVVPISQNRSKKRTVKENSAEREQTKDVSGAVFDKTGNAKSSPDKKSTVKNQAANKKEILTRPRIVKNPKF